MPQQPRQPANPDQVKQAPQQQQGRDVHEAERRQPPAGDRTSR